MDFTRIPQLLEYGRFRELEIRNMANDLNERASLPSHNPFTPVMKCVANQQVGTKCDQPATSSDHRLVNPRLMGETKRQLRKEHGKLILSP